MRITCATGIRNTTYSHIIITGAAVSYHINCKAKNYIKGYATNYTTRAQPSWMANCGRARAENFLWMQAYNC